MAQLIFGRLFWLWIAGFIAAGSFILAESANQIIRLALVSFDVEKEDDTADFPEQSSSDGRSNLYRRNFDKTFDDCNLFSNKCEPKKVQAKKPKEKKKPEPKKEKEKKKREADQYGCPKSYPELEKIPEIKRTRLRLRGTVFVKDNPEASLAALYVKVKEVVPPKIETSVKNQVQYRTVWRVELFSRGDVAMGYKVCSIGPRSVIFLKKDKLYKLSLSKKRKKRGSDIFFGAFNLPKGSEEEKEPTEVDKMTVSRAMLQDWLMNPMKQAMSARIMPYVKNGVASGIRLVWVRKNSLYSKIGLKTGDIVQEINGKPLTVSNALSLYSELPYAKQIRVNIIRKGVRKTIVYNIK